MNTFWTLCHRRWIKYVTAFAALSSAATASAATYLLPPPGDNLIGFSHYTFIQSGQTLQDVARANDIGYYDIIQANPTINPEDVKPWEKILIPSTYILPDAPQTGIVINTASLRLFYYPPNSNTVQTFPAGMGMQGMATPTGQFHIIEKMDHPAWYVPASEMAEMAKQGMYLPKVMPAGPENPLGEYALRLNKRTYLIHGTNTPATVGRRASAGCLHLFPEDILSLFKQVDVGTSVNIVDQPFKATLVGNTVYFQAYQPLREDRVYWGNNPTSVWQGVIQQTLTNTNPPAQIDWQKAQAMVSEQTGVVQPIGYLAKQG